MEWDRFDPAFTRPIRWIGGALSECDDHEILCESRRIGEVRTPGVNDQLEAVGPPAAEAGAPVATSF